LKLCRTWQEKEMVFGLDFELIVWIVFPIDGIDYFIFLISV